MFEGSYVALVTPFNNGGDQIDGEVIASLIDWHKSAGTDGIVVSGTTGEAPTLSTEEKKQLIDVALACSDDGLEVIAGTGSSSTQTALELTAYADEAGCDGALVVCPFYNRPEQEGIYEHYMTLAEHTDIPLILYDNPARSGREIAVQTVVRLANHDNVQAIKEASGDLTHAMKIHERTDLNLLSGSDPLTVPLLSAGGRGAISVVANVVPGKTSEMIHSHLSGSPEESRRLHEELFPLIDLLGRESNPIPVKWALKKMGELQGHLRLPLTPPSDKTEERLVEYLEAKELLQG